MASTFTTNTGIEKIGNGEKAGAWGTTTNTNFDIIDRSSSGYKKITLAGNTHTLDTTDGALTTESSSTSDARYVVYEFETGTASGAVTVTINDNDRSFLYLIQNDSNQTITFTYGSGTTTSVAASETSFIFGNGDSSSPVIAKFNVANITGDLTVSGDASIGDDLSLTSDSAVLNFGADSEVKVTHVADTGLNIKHTATGDDKPVVLTLQTGETDIQANDVIGAVNFQAPDEGTGSDATLVAAGIEAVSEGDFAADNNATKLSFKTGASEAASEKMSLSSGGDLSVSNDLLLNSDSSIIKFGSDSEITLAHVHDSGLTVKHDASGDDKFPTISLATGDNDIAVNDKLGVINFIAPDEGAGTDAITVGAGIEAISEGDFSASVNTTKLSFKTATSGAATETMSLSSGGNLTASGVITGSSFSGTGICTASCTVNNGGGTVSASSNNTNIAGTVDNGVGDVSVTFTNALSGTDYAAVVSAIDDDGTNRNIGETIVHARSTTASQLKTFRPSASENSARAVFDNDAIGFVAFD